MAKYVIDGATLTAIADAIRRASPYDYKTITPEEMPQCIGQGVRDPAFDDGYERGYEKGKADGGVDLEALGELCEVVTVVDSAEDLYVAIYNRHPTFYLHCSFIHPDIGSINVVVAPNWMESYTVSNVYKDFKVDNVRWKASAT